MYEGILSSIDQLKSRKVILDENLEKIIEILKEKKLIKEISFEIKDKKFF